MRSVDDPACPPPATLYLDLLKGVLTRLIFDEPLSPVVPTSARRAKAYAVAHRVLDRFSLTLARREPVVAELRAEGRDHPLDAETMIGKKRLDNLQWCIETALADDVPGDLLEAGVWRGGASILMQGVLAVHGATDRGVWLCDSFAGLPPPNPTDYPEDEGDMLWSMQHLRVSQDEVRRNFERYGLLRDNVHFVEGLFGDTLPSLDVDRLAVLRADGDMYESTIQILDNLEPRVVEGGFVIIDDYGSIPACEAAVTDYRERVGIEDPIHRIDWTGAFWRKGGD